MHSLAPLCDQLRPQSVIIHHHHVPVQLVLDGRPVEDVPLGHLVAVVPGLDHAPGEHEVPHVQVGHLPYEALHGLQTPQVLVLVLPQEDGALWTDGVSGLVDLVGAPLALHPEGCEACARLPGEAEAGAEGGEGGQVEQDAVPAHVEGDASVPLPPHVELVVVGGAVGEQDDLPLVRQLGGHAHAEGEGPQAHLLLRDQGHEAEVRLIGEHQDLLTQTHWRNTDKKEWIGGQMLSKKKGRWQGGGGRKEERNESWDEGRKTFEKEGKNES